jgi:putative transposase
MGRMPRVYVEGALLYLNSKGDHDQDIFRDHEDYLAYLALIKRYKLQYNFKLFSFVLMPNHIHLLIELKQQGSISDIMHDLNSNYTKYFNSRYNRKGHLFQERYKMKLLEKAQYLLPATAHIHLNPVIRHLANNAEEYNYSSYPLHIGRVPAAWAKEHEIDLKEEIAEITQHLSLRESSLKTNNEENQGYSGYLKNLSSQEKDAFAKKLARENVIGQSMFKEKVKQEEARLMANRRQVPGWKLRRKIILASGALVFLLVVITLVLYVRNVRLKQQFDMELEKQETRAKELIKQEKEEVFRNLDEKYRADMVSFEAATKRLELEQKKTRELEETLKRK